MKKHEHDVVEHAESVLADPVEGRVEVTGLEGLEDGLNTVDVIFAVLTGNGVELILQSGGLSLLRVSCAVAFASVAAKESHESLDLLVGQLFLLAGNGFQSLSCNIRISAPAAYIDDQLQKVRTVNGDTSTTAATATASSSTRREGDAGG